MNGIRTRKIVKIDEEKCDGCGVCVPSCAEGAIRVIDGKARLLAENLCDGLGNCLGECPRGAITIEERPAEAFDESAVEEKKASGEAATASRAEGAEGPEGNNCGLSSSAPASAHSSQGGGGCPGSRLRQLSPAGGVSQARHPGGVAGAPASRLGQWPVQLSLVPVAGAIWQNADVLIAADCVGFAMADFHERLLAGKTLVIACPKLDDVQPYIAKLTEIFKRNAVRSITVAHMEVPCCNGIVRAVREALAASGRIDIGVTDITVGVDGAIVDVSEE